MIGFFIINLHEILYIKSLLYAFYANYILNQNQLNIDKVTALWAFSEAALGGILHALKIPFTGLFVGGTAVIFISLIAYFSNSKKVIIESTIKVILVKFVVSPYSPINAYFAVFLQSLLGYILFFNGFNKISPVILGFLSLLFSAFQKVIVLTVVFGMTLWESIDVFFKFVLNQFVPNISPIKDFDISYFIISLYIFLHIIGGISAGIYASNLPARLKKHSDKKSDKLNFQINDFLNNVTQKRKKKKFWQKKSNIYLFIFFVILIVISFLFEEVENELAVNVFFMILRSVSIIVIWYYFLSPIILKIVKKYLSNKKQKQAEEIENIVQLFPNIRSIIKYSWNETQNYNKVKRVFFFFDKVLIHYLLFNDRNEKSN
ncbi:MAG: hypothetical protein H6611_01140 [Ignavibacteriales bacterium]|nr:hypothetical protein [Ignavibacteriales bacterium]